MKFYVILEPVFKMKLFLTVSHHLPIPTGLWTLRCAKLKSSINLSLPSRIPVGGECLPNCWYDEELAFTYACLRLGYNFHGKNGGILIWRHSKSSFVKQGVKSSSHLIFTVEMRKMLYREILDVDIAASREKFSVLVFLLFVFYVFFFKIKRYQCSFKYKLGIPAWVVTLPDMPITASLTATDNDSSHLRTFSEESLLQIF